MAATGAPLAGMRVLLAEDNPINQEVALALLEAQGAVVDVADDGHGRWPKPPPSATTWC